MITLTGLITEPPRTAIRDGFLYALLPVAFCGFDQCKHQRNGSYYDHHDLVTTHSASPAFLTSGRYNHRVLFSLLTTVSGCIMIIGFFLATVKRTTGPIGGFFHSIKKALNLLRFKAVPKAGLEPAHF